MEIMIAVDQIQCEAFEQQRERLRELIRQRVAEFAGDPVTQMLAGAQVTGHCAICGRLLTPGTRLKAGFYVAVDLLPVPDDEAVVHALFEVAMRREPVPPTGAALGGLIEKYAAAEANESYDACADPAGIALPPLCRNYKGGPTYERPQAGTSREQRQASGRNRVHTQARDARHAQSRADPQARS